MNSVTIEKLNRLKERNFIQSQDEFERVFKGTEMGLLKLDQIHEFIVYEIGNRMFDVTNLRWVKGKGERFLKATLDLDNGYVKRNVYLNDNTCYPAAYANQWQEFREQKLALLKPLEDNTQTIFTLENEVAPNIATVEAF